MTIRQDHLRTIRKIHFLRAGVDQKGLEADFDFKAGVLQNEVGKTSQVSVLGRIFENTEIAANLKSQLKTEVIKDLCKNGEKGVVKFSNYNRALQIWQIAEVNLIQQIILDRVDKPDFNPLTAKEKNWLFERFDERFPQGQWFSSVERYVTGYDKIVKQYQADRSQDQANWLSEMLGDAPPVSEEKRKSYILK